MRQPLRAIREEVGRDPHRGPRREDVVPARDVLLEDVVLDRAAKRGAGNALLLRCELVEQEQERSGRVDRHRGRDAVERDSVEEDAHVLDRVDRDARAADLPERDRVVRVVAELRRQVEGDREACLAEVEQVAEPLVRLLRRPEACVLADRPRPAAVHRLVRPARKRVFARPLELDAGDVGRGVDGLHLDAGLRLPAILGRRHEPQSTLRACRSRSGSSRGCASARERERAKWSSPRGRVSATSGRRSPSERSPPAFCTR